MNVFAISDLHLSTTEDKPMDVFGGNWVNYVEKIKKSWEDNVEDDDVVLIPGDISWAMSIDNAKKDIDLFKDWKGKKVILKGNHDYWWNSISKVRNMLPEKTFAIQNDCLRFGKLLVCGTRGWMVPLNSTLSKEDLAIFKREVLRLKMSLDAMQKMKGADDEVVCMMHFPPFNVHRENSEFTELFKEYGIDKVVYGHLHGKDCRSDLLIQKEGVKYYLASCDLVDFKVIRIV